MSWAASSGEESLAPLLFSIALPSSMRGGLVLDLAASVTSCVTLNKCSLGLSFSLGSGVGGWGWGHLGREFHSREALRSLLCPLYSGVPGLRADIDLAMPLIKVEVDPCLPGAWQGQLVWREETFSSVCANSIHFLLFPKAGDVTSPSSSPPLWPIFSLAPQLLKRLRPPCSATM